MATPAERQRRYRDRQRRGIRVATLPVDSDLEEALREDGYLHAWSEGTPDELREALLAVTRFYIVARRG